MVFDKPYGINYPLKSVKSSNVDMKTKIYIKNGTIKFSLNAKIYDLNTIYKACYVFIDRAYIHLDSPEKDVIVASLKGKNKLSKKGLEQLKGEFLNELLNIKLRENISRKNKKILEYIVGGAINASLEKEDISGQKEIVNIDKEIEALKKELDGMS